MGKNIRQGGDFLRKLYRKLIIGISLVLVFMIVSLPGCSSSGPSSPPTRSTTMKSAETYPSTPLPYSLDFNLSKAPALGETVDLTFAMNDIRQLYGSDQPKEGLAKSSAWVDFYWTNIHGSYTEAGTTTQIPLAEVLVSGETKWEGNFNESRFNLRSKIQLPREGIWRIQWNFTGEGWSKKFEGTMKVAVADGTAAIMNTNPEEFKAGPLAYLGFLPYGGDRSQRIPTSGDPFSIGVDISKAPRAGEEVTLNCRILSVIDMSDFSLLWRFYKRTGDSVPKIPSTDLLTSADLAWKTDVRKGEPVVFSTTIKFPTEGEWEILADGNYAENNKKYWDQEDIKITITASRSFFGWAELPSPPSSGTTTILTIQPHKTTD
jgi:hypothetical protein